MRRVAPICLVTSLALVSAVHGQQGKSADEPVDLDALVKQLSSDDENVVFSAAKTLSERGPKAAPAVDGLIRVLKQDNDKNRLAAIFILERIGPAAAKAVPALIEAAQHPRDFHTQYHACIALGAIGPQAKPATPVLLKLLNDKTTSIRAHAAEALGQIGPAIGEEAIRRLTDALGDRNHIVKQSAVIALGRLGSAAKSALPSIDKALAEETIDTRVDAVTAIYNITGDKQRVLPQLIAEVAGDDDPDAAADLLATFGDAARPAVPKFIKLLSSENPDVRYNGAMALGRLGPLAKDAVPALKTLADDEYADVRDAARNAIKRITQS